MFHFFNKSEKYKLVYDMGLQIYKTPKAFQCQMCGKDFGGKTGNHKTFAITAQAFF